MGSTSPRQNQKVLSWRYSRGDGHDDVRGCPLNTFSLYGRTPRCERSPLVTLGHSCRSQEGFASTCQQHKTLSAPVVPLWTSGFRRA